MLVYSNQNVDILSLKSCFSFLKVMYNSIIVCLFCDQTAFHTSIVRRFFEGELLIQTVVIVDGLVYLGVIKMLTILSLKSYVIS